MEPGDKVTLATNRNIRAVVVKLPRNEGRKKPRALIQTDTDQLWVPVSDLIPLQGEEIDST